MKTNWMNYKEYKSRGEGGGVRNILWGEKSWRRLEKKTWGWGQKVVECFPSLSSGYNEQFPKRANWIQTRSDRKTSPSQPPPLLSPITLTPRWSCFILSQAWSSLLLNMSECLQKWVERNPKPEHWVRGALTVSTSCKSENKGRRWCVCFPIDIGLQCSLQALAGGHRSKQEADWGDRKGFNKETGPHHHSLTLAPAYQ